ncbi:hypothetical protein BGZ98_009338 [Dissophora globulifera]|nr:hypothetical protein BGZ98_009338 [Dissophora globulifera]
MIRIHMRTLLNDKSRKCKTIYHGTPLAGKNLPRDISDNWDGYEQEQPIDARPGSEKEGVDNNTSSLYQELSDGEQPATPDLYLDDLDVDRPDGLIDQHNRLDSSEEEELNSAAADVKDAENMHLTVDREHPLSGYTTLQNTGKKMDAGLKNCC